MRQSSGASSRSSIGKPGGMGVAGEPGNTSTGRLASAIKAHHWRWFRCRRARKSSRRRSWIRPMAPEISIGRTLNPGDRNKKRGSMWGWSASRAARSVRSRTHPCARRLRQASAKSASLVVMAPPSPVVMWWLKKKLKVPASPRAPTLVPSMVAPCAPQASSSSRGLWARHGLPSRWSASTGRS